MDATACWNEIVALGQAGLPLAEQYDKLCALLGRLCKELCSRQQGEYSNLFTQLQAACLQCGHPSAGVQRFRAHSRDLQRGRYTATPDEARRDFAALYGAVAAFTASEIPQELRSRSDDDPAAATPAASAGEARRLRLHLTAWDRARLVGYTDEAEGTRLVSARYDHLPPFAGLAQMLHEGMQLNLLSCRTNEAGDYLPQLIVLEPDYLINITTIAECFKPYGLSPWEALLGQLRPQASGRHLLLGNLANRFLDDCINEPSAPERYQRAVAHFFSEYAVELATSPDVDRDFFRQAEQQYANIDRVVRQLFGGHEGGEESAVTLEPTFLCESMGLQGRMDLLQSGEGRLIELKSGKRNEYRNSAYLHHAMQVTLYKEVLYYNLGIPREQVDSYLLYSKYPVLLREAGDPTLIQQAMQLRNQIVFLEKKLRDGELSHTLRHLTPEQIYPAAADHPLWAKCSRPAWSKLLAPIRGCDALSYSYFHAFFSFTAREQRLDKTGDATTEGNRGFSNLWNTEAPEKRAEGNLMEGLVLKELVDNGGIEEVRFAMPRTDDEGAVPNFRTGDIILFYERNSPADNAVNRQVMRGSIQSIDEEELRVRLHCKQRNRLLFPAESRYAVEHDYLDSSYRTVYHGLYSFLQAPEERRRLLLGVRPPRFGERVPLRGDYGERINEIVQQARRAHDYLLLVGPPGTGKTSIALQSMVREFYADPGCNILLLAYTNRAVDEICEALEECPESPDYLRIGSSLVCDERYSHRLLRNRIGQCSNRAQVLDELARYRIVVGTLFSIAGRSELFKLKRFDVAIADEASQILEPQIVGLLSQCDEQGLPAIGKFILIGDHKQLPAISQQSESAATTADKALQEIGIADLRRSFFERLYRQAAGREGENALTLCVQGRMHPQVAEFANRHFYGGTLLPVPREHQCEELPYRRFDAADAMQRMVATRRTAFIASQPVPPTDAPKINRSEAKIIGQIVLALCRLCRDNGVELDAGRQIGIIVPYRNQIALVYDELAGLGIEGYRRITVDTVERYQGSQRDVIIYGTTVSRPYQMQFLSAPVPVDGTMVDRKLNVALTRARKQLFVVGNPQILSAAPLYRDLMRELNE